MALAWSSNPQGIPSLLKRDPSGLLRQDERALSLFLALSFSPALSRSLSLSCAHSFAICLGVGDGHVGALWGFIDEVCPRIT